MPQPPRSASIGLYRTLVFVPFIISATAQGVLFSFIFDAQFGVANAVLDKLGIAPQGFLGDPGQALCVLVLIGLWGGIGFCVIVYLAALQDIPRELVEAASIDGARRWGVLRTSCCRRCSPVTVFLLVWQTFESLQLFDLVFVTTRGGPLRVDDGGRALRLAAGVRVLQRRLRRGGRLRRSRFGLLVVALGAGASTGGGGRRGSRDPARRCHSARGTSCWRRWRCSSRCRCSG